MLTALLSIKSKRQLNCRNIREIYLIEETKQKVAKAKNDVRYAHEKYLNLF